MSSFVGRRLGKYNIIAEIGRDDVGQAYQAQDTLLGRTVRLWLVHPNLLARDPSLRRRLAQAVETLKPLSHPHIARVYGLEEVDGHLLVVSEYVAGRPLTELLSEQRASPPGRERLFQQARQIIGDIGAALDEAHRQGIVGLDICPAGIVVSDDGQATLVDLGLGCLVRSSLVSAREKSITSSPAYLAPELVRGGKPQHQSDLYALGALLYELLTSRPPFQGDLSAVMLAHLHRMPAPPSQVNRQLPQAVDAVLAKALAKDPEARYTGAAQLVADLTASETALPPPTRLPVVSRLPFRLVAVGVLVIALILLLWQGITSWRQKRGGPPIGALSGSLGSYEVIAPKRIRPGERAYVRLAIYTASNVTPTGLPTLPPTGYTASKESARFGSVQLCRYIWARLECPGLSVEGPNTVRRTIGPGGVEWVWEIGCKTENITPGSQPVNIQLFVRQEGVEGSWKEIPLKEISFDIEVASGGPRISATGILIALALSLIVISVLARTFHVRRNAANSS